MVRAREIHLKSRPEGLPQAGNFQLIERDLPAPGANEVLVKNLWMSVDPYMRGRMYDRPSYVPPFALGEALQGGAIGEIVESNDPNLKPGDLVESSNGWRDYFVSYGGAVQKLPDVSVPPQAYLGVLGMPGVTAYSGMKRIGEPKEGQTVFVSGAGGAVGSLVCQMSKIWGLNVVASAGSDEKIAWLKSVGVDTAINYQTCGNLTDALKAAAPKGFDIYFDNVGGEHLEAALEVARPFARFIECGMISAYNDKEPTPGPRNMTYIVGKRIRMQGFIVIDYWDMKPEFQREMTQWIKDGRVKWEETVENGIENAPAAFLKLFSGANIGKMLVKLG
jgi:NADPH-dependent curcumin reductase CurA